MKIRGTGSALPALEIPNAAFAAIVDTNDEWIQSRTGIQSRHFVREETTGSLARAAAQNALKQSGVSPADIDLVICATFTHETLVPSLACRLQRDLGLREDILAFDINAACSGFVYALNLAQNLLAPGRIGLVLGAESLSRVTNFADRATCVLFGDGAGAALVTRDDTPFFFTCGAKGDDAVLFCPNFTSVDNPFLSMDKTMDNTAPAPSVLHMNGQEVFKFAVVALESCIRDVLAKAGETAQDVDHFVCHQANKRILDAAIKRLGVPPERFFMNMQHTANTSAASVAIALDELNRSGRILPGQRLVLAGFGGGLTYGAIYLTA